MYLIIQLSNRFFLLSFLLSHFCTSFYLQIIDLASTNYELNIVVSNEVLARSHSRFSFLETVQSYRYIFILKLKRTFVRRPANIAVQLTTNSNSKVL